MTRFAASKERAPGGHGSPARPDRSSSGYGRTLARWGLLFTLPSVVLLLIFQLYPIGYAFFISFHEYDLLSPPRFVGFDNYTQLVSDQRFQNSLWVTVFYVFFTIVPVIAFSFGLGFVLAWLGSQRGLWRTLLFIPSIMPIVSVALVWKLLFDFQGPINDGLSTLGVDPLPWLNSSDYAPWALIIMSWWHATSYYMIIFLAGFLAIPTDYYEAAKVDGVGAWEVMRRITLPLMRPTIALVVVLATVNGLKTFAFQQIVTDGGPANATQILTLLIYRTSFSYLDVGLASTYSIVLFAGILGVSLIQIWFLRGRDA